MSNRKRSKHIVTDKTASKRIAVGDFLVGENGELWIDPADPQIGLKQAAAFDKIKDLQQKLPADKATHTATRYSNRRPRV